MHIQNNTLQYSIYIIIYICTRYTLVLHICKRSTVVCRRVSLTNPFSKTMPDPEDSGGVGDAQHGGEDDDELFLIYPQNGFPWDWYIIHL